MLLHSFPNLQWLKREAEQSFSAKKDMSGQPLAQKGWPTVILNVKTADIYRDNIRGPVSIFTNLSGESIVEVDSHRVRIKNDYFFVTNQRQHYTLEVGKHKAETFNIHFGDYVAEQTRMSLTSTISESLENKEHTKCDNVVFHNKLYQKTNHFNKLVTELNGIAAQPLMLEQKLYELMALLLAEQGHLRQISGKISVIKPSTREELLKRMLRAVDWMHAYYETDINVDDLATASCLSKFHFLRLFNTAFGQTPHQALTQIRIAKAKELLKHTKSDVKEVARLTGYADASTFSRAFYQQLGVYPSQFRTS